jgi:hypothetical protein
MKNRTRAALHRYPLFSTEFYFQASVSDLLKSGNRIDISAYRISDIVTPGFTHMAIIWNTFGIKAESTLLRVS